MIKNKNKKLQSHPNDSLVVTYHLHNVALQVAATNFLIVPL